MATRKPKADGLQALVAKQEPVSIQELTMQDFFAAFALQGLLAHYGDRGRYRERRWRYQHPCGSYGSRR
jgi:hypothetical protein